jgi:hypothetical protein
MDHAGGVLDLVALSGEALSESDSQHEQIGIILRCKRWDDLSTDFSRAAFKLIWIGRHVSTLTRVMRIAPLNRRIFHAEA